MSATPGELQVPDGLMTVVWVVVAIYAIQTAIGIFYAFMEARRGMDPKGKEEDYSS